jgi:GrpB-like predicted nucleotidyltransferase (UPF0157 family)
MSRADREMKRVTHNRTRWSNADEGIVEIEPYNQNWPDEFQCEANRLRAALPELGLFD